MLFALLYQWVDFLWIPVAVAVTHGQQRYFAVLFVLFCAVSLRMQREFLDSFRLGEGVTNFFSLTPYARGLLVYGFFTLLFFLLSYVSPNTRGVIYMAAALSLYILAFCVSSVIMII